MFPLSIVFDRFVQIVVKLIAQNKQKDAYFC